MRLSRKGTGTSWILFDLMALGSAISKEEEGQKRQCDCADGWCRYIASSLLS